MKLNAFLFHRGTVQPSYKKLLVCNLVSTCIGSVEYAISLQCLFSAMKVSTVGSATLQFLMKDILGQTASLCIVNYVKRFSTPQLLWLTTLFLQLGIVLDFLLLLFPQFLLLLTVFSTASKDIGFTLNSALHIQALNHSVIKRHIGEAYVSYSSASTIAGSLGMGIGIAVTTYANPTVWLILVPVLGILRWYMLYIVTQMVRTIHEEAPLLPL